MCYSNPNTCCGCIPIKIGVVLIGFVSLISGGWIILNGILRGDPFPRNPTYYRTDLSSFVYHMLKVFIIILAGLFFICGALLPLSLLCRSNCFTIIANVLSTAVQCGVFLLITIILACNFSDRCVLRDDYFTVVFQAFLGVLVWGYFISVLRNFSCNFYDRDPCQKQCCRWDPLSLIIEKFISALEPECCKPECDSECKPKPDYKPKPVCKPKSKPVCCKSKPVYCNSKPACYAPSKSIFKKFGSKKRQVTDDDCAVVTIQDLKKLMREDKKASHLVKSHPDRKYDTNKPKFVERISLDNKSSFSSTKTGQDPSPENKRRRKSIIEKRRQSRRRKTNLSYTPERPSRPSLSEKQTNDTNSNSIVSNEIADFEKKTSKKRQLPRRQKANLYPTHEQPSIPSLSDEQTNNTNSNSIVSNEITDFEKNTSKKKELSRRQKANLTSTPEQPSIPSLSDEQTNETTISNEITDFEENTPKKRQLSRPHKFNLSSTPEQPSSLSLSNNQTNNTDSNSSDTMDKFFRRKNDPGKAVTHKVATDKVDTDEEFTNEGDIYKSSTNKRRHSKYRVECTDKTCRNKLCGIHKCNKHSKNKPINVPFVCEAHDNENFNILCNSSIESETSIQRREALENESNNMSNIYSVRFKCKQAKDLLTKKLFHGKENVLEADEKQKSSVQTPSSRPKYSAREVQGVNKSNRNADRDSEEDDYGNQVYSESNDEANKPQKQQRSENHKTHLSRDASTESLDLEVRPPRKSKKPATLQKDASTESLDLEDCPPQKSDVVKQPQYNQSSRKTLKRDASTDSLDLGFCQNVQRSSERISRNDEDYSTDSKSSNSKTDYQQIRSRNEVGRNRTPISSTETANRSMSSESAKIPRRNSEHMSEKSSSGPSELRSQSRSYSSLSYTPSYSPSRVTAAATATTATKRVSRLHRSDQYYDESCKSCEPYTMEFKISQRGIPKDCCKLTSKDCPAGIPKEICRLPTRRCCKVVPKECCKSSHKECCKDPPKECCKDPPKECCKDQPKECCKAQPKECCKAQPKECCKAPPKECCKSPHKQRCESPSNPCCNDPSKPCCNEPPKECCKGPPKEFCKGPPKECCKSSPKECYKVAPKPYPPEDCYTIVPKVWCSKNSSCCKKKKKCSCSIQKAQKRCKKTIVAYKKAQAIADSRFDCCQPIKKIRCKEKTCDNCVELTVPVDSETGKKILKEMYSPNQSCDKQQRPFKIIVGSSQDEIFRSQTGSENEEVSSLDNESQDRRSFEEISYNKKSSEIKNKKLEGDRASTKSSYDSNSAPDDDSYSMHEMPHKKPKNYKNVQQS